ncbi:DNase I-like protein [Dendrothele bispora CBS 962.96]|uniref:DNA-(apurinic or apyrimidinic site) endonuclease n=1 Tax=Dendrothele bispora (strain CBS 962.96) TaxID=1314807 RepID=A0A4V4HHT1_DENBC|nr:DNase I-like protein [Dendrothele bispora CBS 962.96]
MRLLTWNINGIRTVPQYHPWNTLNSFDDILNYLEADIISFQEVKQARNALPKPVALPASYDSFFSFPIHKNGYSGVATYTRADSVVPLKAEEGITGLLHASPVVEGQPSRRNAASIKKPKLVLSREERVSSSDSSYPGLSPGLNNNNNDDDNEVELGPSGSKSKSLTGFGFTSETDLKALDSEGRTLVLDFGLFVLVNVYCPNDGSADEADNNNRTRFKTDFHNALEARIRSLLKEGREVILVGDLNACATINDHCEGDILLKRVMRERESVMMNMYDNVNSEEIFWEEKQSRRWLRDLIQGDKKCFVDVTRMYHPERKEMYTCWNTKISARESNYGTRIDYILVTPNLFPWVKFSDIQPQIKGSDHCPVFVDFHDEREIDGKIVKLRDFLTPCANANNVNAGNAAPPPTTTKRDPPRLAARFWDEYSGKQMLLHSFFKGGGSKKKSVKEEPTSTTIAFFNSSAGQTSSVDFASQLTSNASVIDPSPASTQRSYDETASLKRRRSPSSNLETNLEATQNKKVKQDDSFVSSLATTTASASTSSVKPVASSISQKPSGKDKGKEREEDTTTGSSDQTIKSSKPTNNAACSAAWKALLAKPPAPRCTVHNEEAKESKVNKRGPNKGRVFWMCSRPVGPGYDRGWNDRPREEVDPKWKCNFFMWGSDLKKQWAAKR